MRIHFHRHAVMEQKHNLPEDHVIIDKRSFQEILKIVSLGADAEFICEAVNNHDKLIAKITALTEWIEALAKVTTKGGDYTDNPQVSFAYRNAKNLLREIN